MRSRKHATPKDVEQRLERGARAAKRWHGFGSRRAAEALDPQMPHRQIGQYTGQGTPPLQKK
jgi:hypothetical protein